MDNKIMLFSNCILVKGTNRSVLYDLQRNNYQFIPNSLFELLKNHEKENINDIKKHYKNKYDSIIDDYFDFLLKKEYVFLTKEPELFPNLNLNWDNSAVITNSILCFSKKTNHSLKKLSVNLELFNTKALQFRFFYQLDLKQLQKILNIFKDSRVQHIEIILPYNKNVSSDNWKKLFHINPRLFNVLCFNSPYAKETFVDKQKQHPVFYTTQNITNHSFCGNIHPNNFI